MVAQSGKMSRRVSNYILTVGRADTDKVINFTVANLDHRIIEAYTRLFPAYIGQYGNALELADKFVKSLKQKLPKGVTLDDLTFNLSTITGQELDSDFVRVSDKPVRYNDFIAYGQLNALMGRRTRVSKRGEERSEKPLEIGDISFE